MQPNGSVGPGGSCCVVERERSASGAGDVMGISRSSSRGGYRSDPEHEIEIQLQCLAGSQDDSGGSQHSHRGCSVEDEDEIIVVEEQMGPPQQRSGHGGPDMYPRPGPSDSGESRAHSRNGYKSDGSHGSTQESPMHLKPCHNNNKRRVYGHHPPHPGHPGMHVSGHVSHHGGHHNLNNHPQSYSATHLNAQYMPHQPPTHQPPSHRLASLHPNKHLEASRSFHTFQRQESTTSFHSTHSAPSQQLHHGINSHNLMVNNIESASQASTHSHSSSSSAVSVGPPDYHSLHPVHHPPPSYDQALIKLDIAMRRRAQTKRQIQQQQQHQQQQQKQQQGAYNSLHYVGEFYG